MPESAALELCARVDGAIVRNEVRGELGAFRGITSPDRSTPHELDGGDISLHGASLRRRHVRGHQRNLSSLSTAASVDCGYGSRCIAAHAATKALRPEL